FLALVLAKLPLQLLGVRVLAVKAIEGFPASFGPFDFPLQSIKLGKGRAVFGACQRQVDPLSGLCARQSGRKEGALLPSLADFLLQVVDRVLQFPRLLLLLGVLLRQGLGQLFSQDFLFEGGSGAGVVAAFHRRGGPLSPLLSVGACFRYAFAEQNFI